ncbi:MAG: SMC-Scp complex subunit ScpB [Patescibacteria group bacterium]
MNKLTGQLESILFVAAKPLTLKKLADITGSSAESVKEAIDELKNHYDANSGFKLIEHGKEVELVTAPGHTELVREFLKKEELGELTRPQLEALAVIVYRGPIVKSELEQIRGVNCSLILRNLQIRGLVEQLGEGLVPTYQVTVDFLRFLGITNVKELPNYNTLNLPETLEQLLRQQTSAAITTPAASSTTPTPAKENE